MADKKLNTETPMREDRELMERNQSTKPEHHSQI
jgi:hypothetical protein